MADGCWPSCLWARGRRMSNCAMHPALRLCSELDPVPAQMPGPSFWAPASMHPVLSLTCSNDWRLSGLAWRAPRRGSSGDRRRRPTASRCAGPSQRPRRTPCGRSPPNKTLQSPCEL